MIHWILAVLAGVVIIGFLQAFLYNSNTPFAKFAHVVLKKSDEYRQTSDTRTEESADSHFQTTVNLTKLFETSVRPPRPTNISELPFDEDEISSLYKLLDQIDEEITAGGNTGQLPSHREVGGDSAADAPLSRVFALYLPFVGHGGTMDKFADEVAALWASWKAVFSGVTDFSKFGIDTAGIPNMPYIPGVVSDILRHSKSPQPPNMELLQKASTIVVNDLLIVMDPRVEYNYLPPDCQILYPPGISDMDQVLSELDLESRVESGSALRGDFALKPENFISDGRCFVVPTHLANQDQPVLSIYHELNSINILLDATTQAIVMKYNQVMRLDVDCFLAPGLQLVKPPWKLKNKDMYEMWAGQGGYRSIMSEKVLGEYRLKLGIRDSRHRNVGSTLLGHSREVVAVARLTNKIVHFLLNNDPIFLSRSGDWPRWWLNVASMYGSEVAVNHVLPKESLTYKGSFLDHSCTTDAKVQNTAKPVGSIHSWHTLDFYSKFHFVAGKYNSTEIFTSKDYNFMTSKYYAYTFAVIGKRVREAQRLTPSGADMFNSKKVFAKSRLQHLVSSITFDPNLDYKNLTCDGGQGVPSGDKNNSECLFASDIIQQEVLGLFECPEKRPFAYGAVPLTDEQKKEGKLWPDVGAAKCCSEETDCEGKPINMYSTCCAGGNGMCAMLNTVGCHNHKKRNYPEENAADKNNSDHEHPQRRNFDTMMNVTTIAVATSAKSNANADRDKFLAAKPST